MWDDIIATLIGWWHYESAHNPKPFTSDYFELLHEVHFMLQESFRRVRYSWYIWTLCRQKTQQILNRCHCFVESSCQSITSPNLIPWLKTCSSIALWDTVSTQSALKCAYYAYIYCRNSKIWTKSEEASTCNQWTLN